MLKIRGTAVSMIEIDEENKLLLNFKIFIIMDTDDCNVDQKISFKNGNMFKKYWFHPYVVPIYNSPNADEVFKHLGLLPAKFKDSEKTKLYSKIFPLDKNHKKKERHQLEEFYHSLSKKKSTNLDKFIKYCLNCKGD